MAKAQNDTEKERISLYIDGDLYRDYLKELMRLKIDERKRGVSMNTLVTAAMIEHAKKFKK